MTTSGCKYTEIKKAAEGLDLKLVQSLYSKNPDVHMLNMAIVGAGNTMEELIESRQLHDQDQYTKKRAKESQLICDWAVSNGGSWIFYIQSSLRCPTPQKGESFFSRVKMLKGPGEVKKGQFKTTNF